MKEEKTRGRPKLDKATAKTEVLVMRLSQVEKDLIKKKAGDQSLSEYVRERLLKDWKPESNSGVPHLIAV